MVLVGPGWGCCSSVCSRLVRLLGGIGLIGLVAHGRFGTPPFARQTLTGQRAYRSPVIRWARPQFQFARSSRPPPGTPVGLQPVLPMADRPGTWEPRFMDGVVLGRAHGVANLVGGLWPLLHISSFEMVFGPKRPIGGWSRRCGVTDGQRSMQLTTSSTADGVCRGAPTRRKVLPLYSRRSTWSTCPPGGSPRCTSLTQLSNSAGSWACAGIDGRPEEIGNSSCRRDRISMPAAGCASPPRLPTMRLGWPASSSTSSTSWIDYRARGVDTHAVDKTIHQYDRAAQEPLKFCWSRGVEQNRGCREAACTTKRKRADLDCWERVLSRKTR